MANPPKVFARVVGGVVIEYPVTAEQIRNRRAPLSMYHNVTFINNPEVTEFQVATTKLNVVNKEVIAVVDVRDMNLDEMLKKLLKKSQEKTPETTKIDISLVTPETFQKASQLAEMEATRRLNALARTRRYDSIDSASAFKDSHIEKYREEAQHLSWLRSQIFYDLEQLEKKVLAGTEEIPTSADQMFWRLTPINWGDLAAPSDDTGAPPSGNPVDPVMAMS